ncbi:MAG: chorismate synthase [Christensenellaceae bacterium]|nr:chorismate synthase [Christensenellaceae bacterium]
MKNTFGQNVALTVFGESHGECVGVVVDGLAPGIKIDEKFIKKQLARRAPSTSVDTARRENDAFKIVSGVFNGSTTGTPLCVIIPNEGMISSDYSYGTARPSHADYAAYEKYHGFEDYRGGGHFSGRITAPLVAAGAIALKMLEKKNIFVGTHIKNLNGILDRDFENTLEDIKYLSSESFAVLDKNVKEKMIERIKEAAKNGDSVGGILESVVSGMPCGVGEPWFDSVESQLSHILFSVPAVKGVEFGTGFGFAERLGSEVMDEFIEVDGKIRTKANNNAGINGGITNGEDIVFRSVIKPTPSIFKEQNTVNIETNENKKFVINGRHDPAIIHRARVVVDSVTALCIVDMLTQRFPTDYFLE